MINFKSRIVALEILIGSRSNLSFKIIIITTFVILSMVHTKQLLIFPFKWPTLKLTNYYDLYITAKIFNRLAINRI